ncbi:MULTISPECIES: Sec-independent protein translocase subunit TatA [Nesterenkonia]|uniref:Sec-independent protein translocase protein TatA n=1 Tax=Nesterenkonia xinjiangensis TaxID=225327 RepID=A0A7Z0GNU9_9MICC|nr:MULTISPECIES: Sec-independent protein translocase subunit TatA [Nesterenkonia]MDZ5077974.1 Sec-independent protein translocase subunit TatA [Nesterenkonia sp. HG001]NYJ79421.1 sec-independent protein translocase protein TatA [Nesterenkonia xinjiangensis]
MNITGWQIAIIALLIILLFGAPKLPQLAKSVGQSMRIFKSEVRTMNDESQDKEPEPDADERPAVEGRVVDPSESPRRRGSEQRRDHA